MSARCDVASIHPAWPPSKPSGASAAEVLRRHAGGAPGMSANLAIVWETGATVAITSNQGDTPTAMLLSERLADLLAGQEGAP